MNNQTMNNDVTLTGGENPLLAGRYQVVRQLGTGGMGSVWLAEDTQLDNKPFAVKMLPSILVSNKRAYRQLKDEAIVAMKLVHPNIVQIRAFEENNGNPFLVMDYVEGQTLDDYLAEKGRLTEDETVKILKPIAAALDYAHREGVVHRDVKPANVMIRKDGHPYILDFGIAREIQETMTRVTGKLSSGTLLYMSPEQLRGQPPKPAQDVYSFAAMAYECLKGEPPFSRGQIEYQILNEQPEPLPDGIRLAAAIMRGLSKTPENRPDSCVKVLLTACSIRPIPSARPQVAVPPRPAAQMTDRIVVRPKRNIVGIVLPLFCLIAALLVLGGVLWHREAQRQENARNLAVKQQKKQQAEDERKAQEESARKKAEAERLAKMQQGEAQHKAEEDAKRRAAEKRELVRPKEEEIAPQKLEDERSASDMSPSEMQGVVGIPFDQDPNYERCSDVDFAPVYFPKNIGDRRLAMSERPKIEAVAQHLLIIPDRVVIVTGHCGEGSSNEFGLSVGEHYACIIRDDLVSAGIDGKRIQTRSYGTEKTAARVSNEHTFDMNNRGEFEILRRKTSQQVVETGAVNEKTSSIEFRTVAISSKIRNVGKHSSDGDFAELTPSDMTYLLFQASAENDVALVAKVACTATFKLLTEEQLKNDYQQFKPESQDLRNFLGEIMKVATIRQYIVDESNAKVEIVASKENVERVLQSYRDRIKEKPSEFRMSFGCKKMGGRWRVAAFPD